MVIAAHYEALLHTGAGLQAHTDPPLFIIICTAQQQLISLLKLTGLHIKHHQTESRTQISAMIT